jgi:hypothetical protein
LDARGRQSDTIRDLELKPQISNLESRHDVLTKLTRHQTPPAARRLEQNQSLHAQFPVLPVGHPASSAQPSRPAFPSIITPLAPVA